MHYISRMLLLAFFHRTAAAPFGAIEAALSISAASSPPRCLVNAAMSLRKRTCHAGAKAGSASAVNAPLALEHPKDLSNPLRTLVALTRLVEHTQFQVAQSEELQHPPARSLRLFDSSFEHLLGLLELRLTREHTTAHAVGNDAWQCR